MSRINKYSEFRFSPDKKVDLKIKDSITYDSKVNKLKLDEEGEVGLINVMIKEFNIDDLHEVSSAFKKIRYNYA